MKGKRPPESFVYWWSAVEKRGLGKEIKYCDLDEYIGHWRLVVEVKQVKKVKRKRPPTQHWSNALCTPPVCCTFHSTTAASQRRFLSKNPRYDAVVAFLRRSDLLFTLVSLWCFTGGEEWGLGMRSCLVWSGIQAPSQLSILVSAWAPSHLSRLCIRAPSHLSGPCTGTFSPRAHSTTPADSPFSLLSKGISAAYFLVWNHISVWYMYLTKLFLFDISNQAFTSASTLTSCSPFHHSQAGPWMIATIVSEYCISNHMCCLSGCAAWYQTHIYVTAMWRKKRICLSSGCTACESVPPATIADARLPCFNFPSHRLCQFSCHVSLNLRCNLYSPKFQLTLELSFTQSLKHWT